MKTEYFDCSCHSPDHTIRFSYFEDILDKDDNGLYLEVQLAKNKSWYKRLWKAIKYVFGYECQYGHWDCFLLNSEDIDRLSSLLEKFQNKNINLEKFQNKNINKVFKKYEC